MNKTSDLNTRIDELQREIADLKLRSRRGRWMPLLYALCGALLAAPLLSMAGTVTLPHVFVNGTNADADQVNADFNALVTESNDQDARIAALEAGMSALPTTIRDYVNTNCYLYYGWRDNCAGCTSDPTKWGRVSGDDCVNGTGADNTCTVPNLNGVPIRMYGLNPDGDVDTSDKFYIGLRCF